MGLSVDSGKKRTKGLTPNINVTPLVDVVLVLLIIFMVVIPNVQDGKPIDMLQVREADEISADSEPAVVTISSDETFSLDEDDMSRDSVVASLRVVRSNDPSKPILIRGDTRVPYHVVRDFFAELQQMGFANIALAVGKAREWQDGDAEGAS